MLAFSCYETHREDVRFVAADVIPMPLAGYDIRAGTFLILTDFILIGIVTPTIEMVFALWFMIDPEIYIYIYIIGKRSSLFHQSGQAGGFDIHICVYFILANKKSTRTMFHAFNVLKITTAALNQAFSDTHVKLGFMQICLTKKDFEKHKICFPRIPENAECRRGQVYLSSQVSQQVEWMEKCLPFSSSARASAAVCYCINWYGVYFNIDYFIAIQTWYSEFKMLRKRK